MDPVDTFQTMILAWDTIDSFVFTPFKAYLAICMEYIRLVQDVTKVNTVIGNGKNIHTLKIARDMKSTFCVCLTVYQLIKGEFIWAKIGSADL